MVLSLPYRELLSRGTSENTPRRDRVPVGSICERSGGKPYYSTGGGRVGIKSTSGVRYGFFIRVREVELAAGVGGTRCWDQVYPHACNSVLAGCFWLRTFSAVHALTSLGGGGGVF